MILPDVNLLVHAQNEAAPLHRRARSWWQGVIEGEMPVGLPWAVTLGFVRLATHASVLTTPLRPLEAVARVRTWLAQPAVRVLDPGPRHLGIVEDLLRATGVAGSLTTDTHLAALAIELPG
jgi:hypothetical protein